MKHIHLALTNREFEVLRRRKKSTYVNGFITWERYIMLTSNRFERGRKKKNDKSKTTD